jgi:hypothetical protein
MGHLYADQQMYTQIVAGYQLLDSGQLFAGEISEVRTRLEGRPAEISPELFTHEIALFTSKVASIQL